MGEWHAEVNAASEAHRVRKTQGLLDYEGSCGIDEDLLDASGIVPSQYVEIYNVSNGEPFGTYAIKGARRSGEISLNGAAARKAAVGDLLIICAYADHDESELTGHEPVIVMVDEQNRARRATGAPAIAASCAE